MAAIIVLVALQVVICGLLLVVRTADKAKEKIMAGIDSGETWAATVVEEYKCKLLILIMVPNCKEMGNMVDFSKYEEMGIIGYTAFLDVAAPGWLEANEDGEYITMIENAVVKKLKFEDDEELWIWEDSEN